MVKRVFACTALALTLCAPILGGQLKGPYTDPRFYTSVRFGAHSHWAQPWRAYMETVPASRFLDGIGVNFDANIERGDNPELIARMLAAHGVRNARVEINWGRARFEDDSIDGDSIRPILLACKRHGIRPMILLNGHHGVPCPMRYFDRALAASAHKGDTTVRLTDVEGLIPGYSGFCNLTDYWACEAMVTKVDGDKVTLSKPLPVDLGDAGKRVVMATLKYRPFSPPDTDDYAKTMEGWRHYVGSVASFVTETMGTSKSRDKGFDLEIWNELTFGSNFLNVNNYYTPAPYQYNPETLWGGLVKATAEYVEAHAAEFSGVALCDGFSNTIPWPAASTEPPRVSALSHHPYTGVKNYPADEYKGERLNALLETDESGFIPAYTAVFPEYYSTALQTETDVRDMGPIVGDVYGTKHGRSSRTVAGKVLPCDMWITEVGMAPNEMGITDPEAALKLKAKTTARYLCFYLNKGVRKLFLFSACSGDKWLGIVKDSFLAYTKTAKSYPTDDSAYTSPSLAVISRIAAKMRYGLDRSLTTTRQLRLDSIVDPHDHAQFAGDGTPAHPSLYDRDLFAFLPYQVNAHRFVIPYYVMTRDIRKSLAPEEFTIRVSGIHGVGARITAYDPIADRPVPVKTLSRSGQSVEMTLTATDYPYLLIVEER